MSDFAVHSFIKLELLGVTEMLKLAALNFQCEAKHKCVCYLFPCGFIDFLCGCSAYAELCPAFFLA